jgi:alpha-beta hydrolase superfamily lysophospholipase
MTKKEVVKLELLTIEEEPAAPGVDLIRLQTNAGTISCRYYKADDSPSAVLWLTGAASPPASPAHGMYARLAKQLGTEKVASLELEYRKPGHLIDCVLDVLLGVGFLRKYGQNRVALVGHSFGGSVAINAAVSSPAVVAVAALSSQMTGADDIAELAPRPVLLLHGSADEVRSDIGSRELYQLASEPKELILYENCGHEFVECREKLEADLLAWLRQVI